MHLIIYKYFSKFTASSNNKLLFYLNGAFEKVTGIVCNSLFSLFDNNFLIYSV